MKRVFISSTFDDLCNHRKAVIHTLDRMNDIHIEAMERWNSLSKDPTTASLEKVEQCDILIGIYAYRYGYRPKNTISVTQMEYEHARKLNIPCLVFLVDDKVKVSFEGLDLLQRHHDANKDSKLLLDQFKAQLNNDHVRHTFTTPDDLAKKVSTSLHEELLNISSSNDNSQRDESQYTPYLIQALMESMLPFIASKAKLANIIYSQKKVRSFNSPIELLNSLAKNQIQSGSWVRVKGTPSQFGNFLKTHFLLPLVGMNSNMRLGPPITSSIHPAMGMLGQITSHLAPVGLFPLIDDDTLQIMIYPTEIEAFGVTGLPLFADGINAKLKGLFALFPARSQMLLNVPCTVTGVITMLEPKSVLSVGHSIEDYEAYRQNNKLWVLDLTPEGSTINPIGSGRSPEIWGGLYAQGHLEVSNEGIRQLKVDSFVEVLLNALRKNGFTAEFLKDHSKNKTHGIFGKGIRASISGNKPIYSLHMDANLTQNYENAKSKFDSVTHDILEGVVDWCNSKDVSLQNPREVDFTYTDSTHLYTVLTSPSANQIQNPLVQLIRDWHKQRHKSN